MKEVTIKISDIDCAACVDRLNSALTFLDGVGEAAVNYAAANAYIVYDENALTLSEIAKRIKKAGYGVPLDKAELICDALTDSQAEECKLALLSLDEVAEVTCDTENAVITVSLLPVGADTTKLITMLRACGVWARLGEFSSGDEESTAQKRLYLLRLITIGTFCTIPLIWDIHHIVQFILASIVQFCCGAYFYRAAIRGLRNKSVGMDLLVALSTTIIYLYSSYQAFFIPIEKMLYFMSGTVLITLLLFGKYLELIAMGETANSIKKLMKLQAKTATVIRDGTEKELPIDEIDEHDTVILRSGERVPVDGIILEGHCAVDESMLTGESMPVDKHEGDELTAGTLCRSGAVQMSAQRLGKDTVLSRIIETVRRAQCSKAPVWRFADKIAAVFVPLVIVIAAAVFAIWYFAAAPYELSRALYCVCSLMVIACPCALGLATPTALMVGAGRAAELGVLYRDGKELESACKADIVVFDKTGTLTEGRPEVCGIYSPDGADAEEAVIAAAALERLSNHPLSVAVTAFAAYRFPNSLPPVVSDFESLDGLGLCGTVYGKSIVCGSRRLLEEKNIDVSKLPEPKAAATEICIALSGSLAAVLYIADRPRSASKDTVKKLKDAGLEVWLLTGDGETTAKAIAKDCGIENVLHSVMPDKKAAAIRELKEKGHRVAMVGDGINDAPALTEADVAIALGSGTDVAMDSAGIVLLGGRIEAVVTALNISKATMKTVRQNLLWAAFYNLICIPAAAFGIVNPSMAAAAMTLSSNGVLLNSLRLQKAETKNEK